MSHFDSTVVIGKSVGGGGGPREKVIRTASALNRAQRQGNVTTTKNQFLAANSATSSINGQRIASIASNPDIVKPKAIDSELAATFHEMATALGLKHDIFAKTAHLDPKKVFPKGNEPAVTEDTINKIQAFYGMYVKGDLKGTRHGKPMKARAYRAKLASKFPGLIEEDKPATKPVATKPAATKP